MKWQYVLISFNVDILVKSVVAKSLMFVVFAILQILDRILPFTNQFHLRSCICLMVCSGLHSSYNLHTLVGLSCDILVSFFVCS